MKQHSLLVLLGLAALLVGCGYERREDLCDRAERMEASLKACAADSSCRSTSNDYWLAQRYRSACGAR